MLLLSVVKEIISNMSRLKDTIRKLNSEPRRWYPFFLLVAAVQSCEPFGKMKILSTLDISEE